MSHGKYIAKIVGRALPPDRATFPSGRSGELVGEQAAPRISIVNSLTRNRGSATGNQETPEPMGGRKPSDESAPMGKFVMNP